MNRGGRRQKAVGSGACAVGAVVLALRTTATTGAQAGDTAYPPVAGRAEHSAEPRLTITLRVYNYAHVATPQLSRAEEEATSIFRQAGVETAWVDCPLSGAELERLPPVRSE